MAELPDALAEAADSRIVFMIMDGIGGLPHPETGRTELETAATPSLDRLAREGAIGLIEPVLPGITPGSGPAHLALFGYDPIRCNIGRGVLSALGVGFELRESDVAARLNFATLDESGRVVDRRAGRPDDAENRRLLGRLREEVRVPEGVEVFWESEKEHRAVLIVRGGGLSAAVSDTDPQHTGVEPLPVRPLEPDAERTAGILQAVLDGARDVLSDEPRANGVLARGIAAYVPYPSFAERYRLRALAVAQYPMYRGLARLVGMEIQQPPESNTAAMDALASRFGEFDFHFVHLKDADARGEDGDFDAKVAAIEELDALVPRVEALDPDVLVITGDHSTPAGYRAHTWHPVPVLIRTRWARRAEVTGFGERDCLRGELGIFPSKHLMSLALAHAGRLGKYGA